MKPKYCVHVEKANGKIESFHDAIVQFDAGVLGVVGLFFCDDDPEPIHLTRYYAPTTWAEVDRSRSDVGCGRCIVEKEDR